MKVNLLLDNPAGVRNGYINIDPFAPDNDRDRVKGDVSTISHSIDDGEASEILAYDILDFFAANMADEILAHWLSKLAHGGTLTVAVIDLLEVARGVTSHIVSIEQAQDLLHGLQEKKWDLKKSSYTLQQLVSTISSRGYKVLSKRVENYRAIVTCQRP